MPTQLLVNVLSVGPLGAGASVTVAHGLRSNDQPVRPTLIQPNQATPIVVVSANTLTATFQNPTGGPLSAVFRFERGYSPEVDADTVGDLYWAGAASGGGGGGVGPGLVPVPAGSPSFSDGTPVTINNLGALAAASALTINTAPAIGLYVTVSGTGYIRVAGEQTVAGPLVTGTSYYLASGGGITSMPPSVSGNVVQYLGRATGATTLFVSPATIVVA